jgi:hypothetical protein
VFASQPREVTGVALLEKHPDVSFLCKVQIMFSWHFEDKMINIM